MNDFPEKLLDEPISPEPWECCDSGCGDACVYEIYRRDKADFDAQQARLKAWQADQASQ